MASSGSSGNGSAFSRLFRNEGLVSDADLRVDVARYVSRMIVDDAVADLDEACLHARGSLRMSRLSRARQVGGNYVSRLEGEHSNMVGQHVEERVHGGVDYRMQRDCDVILGGAYVNTIAGPYARLCAWADYMIWGGWLEVDTIRIEIADVMIRAFMFYCHAVLLRVALASNYVDDFLLRNENFGILFESHSSVIHLGGPGGSMELAT